MIWTILSATPPPDTGLPDWVNLALGPAGLLAFLLVVVVWGGIKRWWVFGWQFEAMSRERDMYRQMAFKALDSAETGVKVAEHIANSSLENMANKVDEARARGEIR